MFASYFTPSAPPGNTQCSDLRNAAYDPPSYATSGNLLDAGTFGENENPGNIVDILHEDAAFKWGYQFDLIWFESIHVDPRVRDLGFILSTQQVTVRVWNAYRWRAKRLTSVDIEGTVGIEFDPDPTLPQHYPATEQIAYTLVLAAEGAPFVENTVTWNFSPEEGGTDLHLSGVRLVPFPFMANHQEPIVESIGFETDIITAQRGDEQRIQLKEVPRYFQEYLVDNEREHDSQLMQALLYGWQARAYGVPVWQNSQPLAASLGSGSTVIPVDTEFFGYEDGGLIFLWSDPHNWEVATIDTVSPTEVSVTNEIKNTWPAGSTYVMPMQLGRFKPSETMTWRSVDFSSMRVKFSMEASE